MPLRFIRECHGTRARSVDSFADGAQVAQKNQPSETVLIRNVATRPADRNPTALDTAPMESASGNPQEGNVMQGTGKGETAEHEMDDLTAGMTDSRPPQQPTRTSNRIVG
jgi:hypothetical protein